jgi:hypothetical protein
MDWLVVIFISFAALLGILLWIYEHPPRDRGKRSGRGEDFED